MKQDQELLHKRISKSARGTVLADREIIFRSAGRVVYVPLPRFAQMSVLAMFGLVFAWLVHASYAYIAHDRVISEKDAALAERERAFYGVTRELETARKQFADVTDSLEKNHKGLVALIGQNQTLKGNLKALRGELKRIDEVRQKAEADKAELSRQVATLEDNADKMRARNKKLTGELDDTGDKLTAALADKTKAHRKGVSLNTQLTGLQQRLSDLRDSQAAILDRITDTSQTEIKRLRDIIASTGVKVDRLLRKETGKPVGQGGPFEPAREAAGESFDTALTGANGVLDHLQGLQKVMRRLPLAAPLDYYYITSRYGPRKDPFNGKRAMHRGLDLGAKYRATVRSTAPGVVTFAGWKGRYGRLVEIDHGNGVVTRYGHLRRIHVKRGQKVTFRQRIGQMGNSGRSTGRHLHYEIHVDRKSMDPLRFLKAGKNVFKG